MTEVVFNLDALSDAVSNLSGSRLEPVRRAALEKFSQQGLPTARHEDWKYTDMSPVLEVGFEAPPAGEISAAINAATDGIEADWLVITNGQARPCNIQGVDVALLSETSADLDSELAWVQLNTALLRDGLDLRIASGTDIERTIGLLFLDDASAANGMSQGRVRIDMGENSKARFVELHISHGQRLHHANSVVDLTLRAGACANYVRIQNRARHHTQTARLMVDQRRDSEFVHAAFDIGGALARNDLAIGINAAGASSTFDGLYLGGNDQHIDNHTRIDHRVGPAESRQEYRGILTGNARCVWNGKAVVHKGADGTDAAQANHNLLLSDRAEIDAKPELEIYADEVKCSHGTTVGQLDDASLYYLRTRGLDKNLARQVLTHAFAKAVIEKTPVESVSAVLSGLLEQRLNHMLGELEP